ncbi:MAG: nucleoid-associated protein [Clostridia bacterium]|nr:nucleoid-associated protein [Clostridia bacterium]
MILNKAVLHILDPLSEISVMSTACLNFVQPANGEFINKQLEKIEKDPDRKKAKFQELSPFRDIAQAYSESGKTEQDLVILSTSIAQYYYDKLRETDDPQPCDILVAEYTEKENLSVALMIFSHKTAFTHNVISASEGPETEIIKHKAILPSGTSKPDSYALVNLTDFSVVFFDKKKTRNGKSCYVLRDDILSVEAEASSREVVKAVDKAVKAVAEEFGANSTQALQKARNFIFESAAEGEYFELDDVSEVVFEDNLSMKNTLKEKLHETKLPKNVQVDRAYAERQATKHRIKTDTGIEISFPSEFTDSTEYMEFINNPDGTISIELKKIGKIENK